MLVFFLIPLLVVQALFYNCLQRYVWILDTKIDAIGVLQSPNLQQLGVTSNPWLSRCGSAAHCSCSAPSWSIRVDQSQLDYNILTSQVAELTKLAVASSHPFDLKAAQRNCTCKPFLRLHQVLIRVGGNSSENPRKQCLSGKPWHSECPIPYVAFSSRCSGSVWNADMAISIKFIPRKHDVWEPCLRPRSAAAESLRTTDPQGQTMASTSLWIRISGPWAYLEWNCSEHGSKVFDPVEKTKNYAVEKQKKRD